MSIDVLVLTGIIHCILLNDKDTRQSTDGQTTHNNKDILLEIRIGGWKMSVDWWFAFMRTIHHHIMQPGTWWDRGLYLTINPDGSTHNKYTTTNYWGMNSCISFISLGDDIIGAQNNSFLQFKTCWKHRTKVKVGLDEKISIMHCSC